MKETYLYGMGERKKKSLILSEEADNHLDFSLHRVDSGKIVLSEQDSKLVLINFWAITCPFCLKQIEDLVKIDKEFNSSELTIIGICLDKDVNKIKEVIQEYNIAYPVAISEPDTPWKFGGFAGVPATFLLDSEKNIIKKYSGYINMDIISKDLERELKAK